MLKHEGHERRRKEEGRKEGREEGCVRTVSRECSTTFWESPTAHYEEIRCEIGASIVIILPPENRWPGRSKQASITYTVHETQLAPGPGGIDQFRRRCIHSSKHSHMYWGAQQPFRQHAIGTVQYIHSTPTSNQGSFRVCQFPQCMDRPVQYQGPAARLFVREILIQITRSKYGNAPCQIHDDLFAYNYRYEKASSGCIVLELSMSSLKP